MAYCDRYGSWLATASNGQVQPEDATRTARTRVLGLMGQIDAYAARDYGQARFRHLLCSSAWPSSSTR
jgi:hypothetical protein